MTRSGILSLDQKRYKGSRGSRDGKYGAIEVVIRRGENEEIYVDEWFRVMPVRLEAKSGKWM
jgi:hypothetical protein